MKLGLMIEALVTLQQISRQLGSEEPEVFLASDDGGSYEPVAEVRVLTPEVNGAPGAINCIHLVPSNTEPFWPGLAQFHIRCDGTARSIIPSLERDVVSQAGDEGNN